MLYPTRKTLVSCFLAAGALFSSLNTAAAQSIGSPQVNINHQALAADFLNRSGFDPEGASQVSVEQLLERSFFTMRVGVFDLGLSSYAALSRTNGDNFALLAGALLEVQAQFLEWLGPKAPGIKEAEKDLKTLRSYFKKLRGNAINKLDHKQTGDVMALLGASKKALEAQERFGRYMARGTALGLDREDEYVDTFLVAPGRRDFLELLSTFGAISPPNQGVYWTNDVATWTNTYFNDISVVALEFASLGSTTGGAFAGISMNSRTPTGMQQQISQLAGNAMIDNLFGDKIPPSLAGALSVNLVVEIYGECNTRVDGDLRARRTQAREIFVPGGLSEGGILPPNLADSRWRSEHGKDHFLVALQSAQAAGASEARKKHEKNGSFELMDDREAKRMVVKAPFLGTPAADAPPVPDDFWGDSLEFYRSYRTGFIYWLRTKGQRSKKSSEAAFAAYLTQLAQAESGADSLEATFEEQYGKPLSAKEPSKQDLEGQFLDWLSKL